MKWHYHQISALSGSHYAKSVNALTMSDFEMIPIGCWSALSVTGSPLTWRLIITFAASARSASLSIGTAFGVIISSMRTKDGSIIKFGFDLELNSNPIVHKPFLRCLI